MSNSQHFHTVSPRSRSDVLVMMILAAAAGAASWWLSGLIPTSVYADYSWDVWFESDLPRIYQTMTSHSADPRSTHHPVFAIVVLLPTSLLMWMGVEPFTSVRLVLAGFSAMWPVLLFRLLRAVGCPQMDAIVFTLVGLCGSATLFFFGVPETFLVGSLTIMLGLIWAASDERGERSLVVEALVSGATLAISITNWMVGLLSTFYRRRLRQALTISCLGFGVVALVWTIQSRIVPSSQFFLGASYFTIEREHLLSPEAIGPDHVLWGFFAHPMVMPAIQAVDRPSSGRWPLLLTQSSLPGSSEPLGIVALVLWAALLVGGVAALVRLKDKPRLRLLVGTSILGQCALHLVFGNETFFYSLHWVPLLVVLAAYASQLRQLRTTALVVAVGFCFSAGANNLIQFSRALQFLKTYGAMVQTLELAERRETRTADPWPKAAIVVETPWDRDDYDQAAYEPAGSLWPSMDTFNIGFWVTDPTGKVLETSHSFRSEEVQSHVTTEPGQGPRITAATPYYRLAWQCEQRRRWRLDLEVLPLHEKQLFLVLRGVGWQFSRIRSVVSDGGGLLINGRWRVETSGAVGEVRLGREGPDGWTIPDGKDRDVTSEIGWGFARIGPLASGTIKVTVFDERASGSVDTVLGPLDGSGRLPGASAVPNGRY